MSTLGARIKTVRIQNNLKQAEFGNLLGIAQSHITNIEKDQKIPSDILIKALCLQFGIREEWLRTGNEPMYRPVEEAVEEALERYGSPFVDTVLKSARKKGLLNENQEIFQSIHNVQIIKLVQKLTPRQRRILEDILGEWTDKCK